MRWRNQGDEIAAKGLMRNDEGGDGGEGEEGRTITGIGGLDDRAFWDLMDHLWPLLMVRWMVDCTHSQIWDLPSRVSNLL